MSVLGVLLEGAASLAYDEAKHPRGTHGEWVKVAGDDPRATHPSGGGTIHGLGLKPGDLFVNHVGTGYELMSQDGKGNARVKKRTGSVGKGKVTRMDTGTDKAYPGPSIKSYKVKRGTPAPARTPKLDTGNRYNQPADSLATQRVNRQLDAMDAATKAAIPGEVERAKAGGMSHPEAVRHVAGKHKVERNAIHRLTTEKGLRSVKESTTLSGMLDAAPLAEAFGASPVQQAYGRGGKASGTAPRSPTVKQAQTEAKVAKAGTRVGGRTGAQTLHAPAGPGGGQFIQSGSSGAEVRGIQHRVGARVDGQYGSQTTAAVKTFQRTHRLVVDGVVGRQTALALSGQFSKARATAPGALASGQSTHLSGLRPVKAGKPPGRSRGGVLV